LSQIQDDFGQPSVSIFSPYDFNNLLLVSVKIRLIRVLLLQMAEVLQKNEFSTTYSQSNG